MEPYEPHLAIATALAVGLLIGLEREQAHPDGNDASARLGGVRTYPIVAILGAIATLLAAVSAWVPLVALAGVIALAAISYAADIRRREDHGITTETSLIATYLLGALAASRGAIEPMAARFLLVMALGVALTFLLSAKQRLHGLASRVSREDYYATVKFLIVAVIVLPLLPRDQVGPLAAIEPFVVGVMIVTISALSFIGYVAMRLLGPGRGLLASAALGGLASSTAVTLSLAGRTKEQPELAAAAAGAWSVASVMMVLRIAVVVGIVQPRLLLPLALPLAGAALAAAAGALVVYRKADTGAAAIAIGNPFELGSAIRFGLVFAAILLATKAAKVYLGDAGLYVASGVAGTTDVDAVTLSSAHLWHATIGTEAAVIAIAIAAGVNTLAKAIYALVAGGRAFGVRALVLAGATLAGGAAGLVAAALV